MASGFLGAQPWGGGGGIFWYVMWKPSLEGTLAGSLVAVESQGHPEYLSGSRGVSLSPVLLQKGSPWKDLHTRNGGVYFFNPGIWNAGAGGSL